MDEDPTKPADSMRVEFSSWGSAAHGGVTTHTLVLPAGTTVRGVLEHAAALLGTDFRKETASEGSRFIVINDAYCAVPRDLERKLEDGDVITLMPFVAGG
jgi:molybdopterin converting factor small subunit